MPLRLAKESKVIDYSLLAKAGSVYELAGFTRIEAPWIVTKEVIDITAPPGSVEYPIGDEGLLVASGEQSFLELMSQDLLPKGRWQCITPCFRGDALDELHKRYFMKLELIDTKASDSQLNDIMGLCLAFFRNYVSCAVVPTYLSDGVSLAGTTFDIVTIDSDIELGSYGIRTSKLGSWIYATGCAEPRLSYAIANSK